MSFATLTLAAALVGAACGVHGQVPAAARYLLPLVLALSVASWWRRRPRVSLALVSTGFALAAAILAADTRDRALHSTLRALLEARYGHFALETLTGDVSADPLIARFRIVED